ncbi:hypothetical protein BV25DRAFT_945601 [Artomyces pyxidatus]|uniref:Uncharacterized protein n=1 Tax=Artomyces pyxidatus TaxID=48021 RepID=A0ACB8SVS5_9AGAM|nr:hypothetical protein BV25DRAFT_945601 [Artomyces pyxidatus]
MTIVSADLASCVKPRVSPPHRQPKQHRRRIFKRALRRHLALHRPRALIRRRSRRRHPSIPLPRLPQLQPHSPLGPHPRLPRPSNLRTYLYPGLHQLRSVTSRMPWSPPQHLPVFRGRPTARLRAEGDPLLRASALGLSSPTNLPPLTVNLIPSSPMRTMRCERWTMTMRWMKTLRRTRTMRCKTWPSSKLRPLRAASFPWSSALK